MPRPPSVTFLCPACESSVVATDLAPECPSCHARVDLFAGTGFERGAPIERCAACNTEALFIAKDFNQKLGVAIVALGCIGFFWGALYGMASLAALTVLDRVVYYQRPLVTVCYACRAVYRDLPRAESLKPYELTFDETFEGTGTRPPFRRATG